MAVDTNIVSVLAHGVERSHCSHCMASTLRPLHCPSCSTAVFCSDSCRTAALDTHHKYECKLALADLNTLQMSKSDNSQSCSSIQLLIRFFTQKTRKYFAEHQGMFEQIIACNIDDSANVYSSQDYSRLLALVSHPKRDLLGQTWQICLALFVLKCLSYCGWLQEELSFKTPLTNEHLYLVALCVQMR